MVFKIRNDEAKEDALRASGKAIISLVAERSGQVLGHILFSLVTATPPSQEKGLASRPLLSVPTPKHRELARN